MATIFAVEVQWNGEAWQGETSYARHISIRSGFERSGDAVAGVGRCTVVLDNRSRRFSPGNTASPLYPFLKPRRRLRVRTWDGETSWTLFSGWIERIEPESGPYGERRVRFEVVDGIGRLAGQRIGVAHEDSKPVDEAVQDIVHSVYFPLFTDFGDNGDVLHHYGAPWLPEKTTALDALRDVCAAVWGRFYLARDGTAIFRTRTQRQTPSTAVALTLDDGALDDLHIGLDVNSVINRAQVTVYPVETVGAPQEVWRARTVLRLAPGQQRVVYANFHDDNTERCAAVDVSAPEPYTDYTVNEYSDGSGFDYTDKPAFDLSAEIEATRAAITLTNTAIGPLYVTLLRVRGRPIRTYDPITLEGSDITSQYAYEVRGRAYNLPMQPDPVFGEALANYFVVRHKEPQLAAERLQLADRVQLAGVDVFSLELLDRIAIADSQSGLSAVHLVRAVAYEIDGRGFRVTFELERADDTAYWLLESDDFGHLGETTHLAL
ncbi:MAG: hypothetical protein GYB65_14945 [Chloroflexi bacterium]|nr:hypothetical protein [Chloroflexota bacterium]